MTPTGASNPQSHINAQGPKSTDLNIGAVRLAIIEDRLNTMPRKLHDWHSAHSVYTALCRNDR